MEDSSLANHRLVGSVRRSWRDNVHTQNPVYVKSLCDAPCKVEVRTSPVGGCYVIKVGSNDLNENFAPTEVREVNLKYWASKAIEHGTYNFDLGFYVYPAA